MGLDDRYHAWILVRDPRQPKGTLTAYSGKSGVGFELGLLSAVANKVLTGSARDKKADQVINTLQKLRSFRSNAEAYREAMSDTTWGPLLKLKNWESDSIGQQDQMYTLVEAGKNNVTQEQVISSIDRIASAFDNYAQNVPYDPYPQISSNENARNSNSFAYTLKELITPRPNLAAMGFQPERYPGWGLLVPGLAPNVKK